MTNDELLQKIEAVVKSYEQENHSSLSDSLDRRVDRVIRHYQNIATSQLTGSKKFRDEMLTYLRALAMILETVGNAGTHAEKAARLRGVVELLESTIQKLWEVEFDFQWAHWREPDVFRSDYPVVTYIRRIRELEHELERAKNGTEATQ